LQIPSGSYEVILESRASGYDERGPGMADPPSAPQFGGAAGGGGKRRYASAVGWALVLILGLGAVIAIGMYRSKSAAERWARDNFPTLRVLVENAGGNTPEEARLIEAQRHGLNVALNRYLGFRILDGKEADADFIVRIFAFHENTGVLETFSLVETKTDRVIWSARRSLDSSNVEENAQSVAFDLASISGSLNAHLRRRGYDVGTSQGCWLRFTESTQTYNTFGDAKLEKCAAEFYANREPPTRISTMLYGWTLTDQSIVELREDRRRAKLEEARTVLQRGFLLNPDTPQLQIALMRAHSFAHDRDRVIQIGRDAVENANSNRTVLGMAGHMLAMWNDPAGERILSGLDQKNSLPLVWEHIGLFVAAMMRDDTARTGAEVKYLEGFEKSQPLLLILHAAHLTRIGQPEAARAKLDALAQSPRFVMASPDKAIERLPMAPEVRQRLREWLVYRGK